MTIEETFIEHFKENRRKEEDGKYGYIMFDNTKEMYDAMIRECISNVLEWKDKFHLDFGDRGDIVIFKYIETQVFSTILMSWESLDLEKAFDMDRPED